jgi:hypothetical protein
MMLALPSRLLSLPKNSVCQSPQSLCKLARRHFSSSSNHEGLARQDLQDVLNEVKALQTLIREQRSQTFLVESLTRSLAAQNAQLERRLLEIEHHVAQIGTLTKLLKSLQEYLYSRPAIKGVVERLESILEKSAPMVKSYKHYLLGATFAGGLLWRYRAELIYQRTSEEVADLARRTLEQDALRLSIQETLATVANSPATLQTLNDLVQTLITHERTEQDVVNLVVHAVNTPQVQKALLDLLEVVFQDPNLQRLASEFLLKGLDIDSVKKMLDAQTQELVRATVHDDSVQQATAVGIQRTLWYAITPRFLWRWMEHHDNDGSNANVGSHEDACEKTGSDMVRSAHHGADLSSQ